MNTGQILGREQKVYGDAGCGSRLRGQRGCFAIRDQHEVGLHVEG